MNDCKFYGNIAQAPVHGQTNSDLAYCNFSIGVRNIRKKKKYSDKSTFIDFVVYGPAAEWMKNAGQGDEILIADSEIEVVTWENKETGKKNKKYRLLVHKFILPKDKNKAMLYSTDMEMDENNQWTNAREPEEIDNPFGG